MRVRTIGLIAACAAALAGCGAPSATLLPSAEPEGEVTSYFGTDAPALALVDTDPDSEGAQALVGALARAGALDPLRGVAKERGLVAAQVRRLLGGELAVGIPRPGAAPLLALLAEDGGELRSLADSRVVGGRATVAGSYRGAALFAARDHAFAVRDRVLLVSRRTADLRDALDRRAGESAFKTQDLESALPEVRSDALARAVVALDGRAGERGRSVPWLAALETLGVVLRADDDRARVDFSFSTVADDLLEVDVPVSPGERAPLAVTAKAPSLSVRDLAHVLGVAERAARAAYPFLVLRLDQARRTLRREGKVDLDEDVLARLHGPATVVRAHDAVFLRADPSRPRALRRALERLAQALPSALARGRVEGMRVRWFGGFYELLRDGRVVGRVGMRGDVLVAGTGTPRALRALARAPLARPAGARGGLTVSVPEQSAAAYADDLLGVPLPWRVDGWARGAREDLRGALHVAW
jgi:hypothetical protein